MNTTHKTKEEIFQIGLPKWPALVVVGENVTKDQAKEILIRTDDLFFSSNDRTFDAALNNVVYGIRKTFWDIEDSQMFWDRQRVIIEQCKLLGLSYLRNHRIVSSWIGGPHGWCKWNGEIGCHNYNIGKWPSIEEVYNEWVIIASAFPFLKLKSQLFNCEAGEEVEGGAKPIVEFNITLGQVQIYEPTETLKEPRFGDEDVEKQLAAIFSGRDERERGCTIEEFEQAFNYVKGKYL